MHPVLAQAAEVVDAAKGWGDQLPALGLGLLGMGALVYFFLRHLGQREKSNAEERKERDATFTAAFKDVAAKSERVAELCHSTQAAATERERETAEALGAVKGALERNSVALDKNATVTQDVGRIAQEVTRELERTRERARVA